MLSVDRTLLTFGLSWLFERRMKHASGLAAAAVYRINYYLGV